MTIIAAVMLSILSLASISFTVVGAMTVRINRPTAADASARHRTLGVIMLVCSALAALVTAVGWFLLAYR